MTIGALVTVPDLQAEGLARLTGRRGGYSTLRFLITGAEMTQEDGRVLRYALMPGTRVETVVGGEPKRGAITARRVVRDAASGLLIYGFLADSGAEAPLREDAVVGLVPIEDPVEQLATVQFNDLRPVFARAGSNLPPEPWGAATLSAREELLAWRDAAWAGTNGVIGLAAARVTPLPHQLLVAQRALSDRQVRFLLADEVGLGKTIEAGLIIQSLLAMKPDLRVLVIAPGALLSQWFLELYTRFGGQSYRMLDGERIRAYEGNPWADENFVLASSKAVEELEGKDALRLATSKWDVVVVDECHRMAPGGVLYKRVAVLSKATPHVLLLSATPARQHADAALALMALLQPQVWSLADLPRFLVRQQAVDDLGDLVARTRTAAPGSLAEAWSAVGDPVAAALAARPDEAGRTALLAYARDHLDPDRRVIRNRRSVLARLATATGVAAFAPTTRSRLLVAYQPDEAEAAVRSAVEAYRKALVTGRKALPPRLAHWLLQVELSLAAHPQVLERMLAMRAQVVEDPDGFASYRAKARVDETLAQVLRSDLSENEVSSHIAVSAACSADPVREAAALATLREAVATWAASAAKRPTARLSALIARIKAFWKEQPDEKILVFTTHALAVEPIATALRRSFGPDAVGTFGAHQDTIEREDAARRFKSEISNSILVCDPLGGEGRNFQFVSAIAHHDLPWSLAAVEQRIGRVDRLGRDGDIPSWVFASEDGADRAWADLLHEAVGVFTGSSSGLEFIADAIETRAVTAALTGGPAALRAAIPAAVREVADERNAREKATDDAFAVEADTYAAAARAAAQVAAVDAPAGAVARWVRGLGGDVRREEEHPQPWRLRTRHHDEPQSGTYDRDAALAHPHLGFYGIGHRLIDRLVDDAASATWCRAAAWRRRKADGMAPWNGVRAVLVLVPDLLAIARAGLRLEVLRRLFLVVPPVRLIRCAGNDDGALVPPGPLADVLAAPFSAKAGDGAVSAGTNREAWTKPLLAGQADKVLSWQAGVRRAATAIRTEAEVHAVDERQRQRAALDAALLPGLAAARALAEATAKRHGPDHPDSVLARREADEEERQVTALQAAVDGARFDIETLAFVAVV